MGKLTEYITYLNVDKHPTGLNITHFYRFFTPDFSAKAIRSAYRKELGKSEEEEKNLLKDLENEK